MLKGVRAAIVAMVAVCVSLAAGAAGAAEAGSRLPIIFVHGNGDTAGVWLTTIWRFESNGYPPELLDAVDFRYPLARDADSQEQPGRSSTADVMRQLAQEVDAVRGRTGAEKVILVANSRGGNTVRNYLKNGGGGAQVAIAVLCGATNHGVFVSETNRPGSEFNGASAFMTDLNSTPDEVVPDVRFLTIRSKNNDKYAQPEGLFLGEPGVPTGVGYDAPELKGATNVVLPGIDNRETAFGPLAFIPMHTFITGQGPLVPHIVPEEHPVLNGKVSAFESGAPTNIGITGATVEIYRISPETGERLGAPAHRSTTGEDGMWGPFTAEPEAYYEFVVAAQGYPVTHIYRSPFPRSSPYINLRPQLLAADDKAAGAVVYMTRPRGYFGIERDMIELDGALPPGINPGVPGTSSAKRAFPAEPQRMVAAVLNRETIPTRTWPIKDGQVSVAEFTY